MNFTVTWNPYEGLAESVVTSNPLVLRDAFDFTLSTHTTAGTASVLTYQTSNWTGRLGDGNPPEATYSDWTTFTPSAATVIAPILGVPYARILRTPSSASHVFLAHKLVR